MNSTKVLNQTDKTAFQNPKFKASLIQGFKIGAARKFNENKRCPFCEHTFTSETNVEEHISEFHTNKE